MQASVFFYFASFRETLTNLIFAKKTKVRREMRRMRVLRRTLLKRDKCQIGSKHKRLEVETYDVSRLPTLLLYRINRFCGRYSPSQCSRFIAVFPSQIGSKPRIRLYWLPVARITLQRPPRRCKDFEQVRLTGQLCVMDDAGKQLRRHRLSTILLYTNFCCYGKNLNILHASTEVGVNHIFN